MRQLDLFLDAVPLEEEISETKTETTPHVTNEEVISNTVSETIVNEEALAEHVTEPPAIDLTTTLSPEFLDSFESSVSPVNEPAFVLESVTENNNTENEEPSFNQNDAKPHVLDVVYFESFDLADGNEPLRVPKAVTSASKKVTVILPALENTVEDSTLSAQQLTKIIQPKKRGRKSIKQMEAEADAINVPDDEVLFQKQYYTMGEVCGMFNVNHSLLRYWEGEFTILQPRKNRKGDRLFRPEDIKNIEIIYRLTRIKKYTIQGAKDHFKTQKLMAKKFEIVQQLEQLKKFLLEIKAKM